jgi:hypothetical protein
VIYIDIYIDIYERHNMNKDTSTTNTSNHNHPISESIQAVAQKILEKANTLQSERNTLEQLTILESTLEQSYQDEKVLRTRHGLELELMQTTHEEQDVLDRLEMYKEEMMSQEKEMNGIKDVMEEERKVMAPHLCKIRLYQMHVEGDLEQKQTMKRKRQEQLDELHFQHERDVMEEAEFIKEYNEIENDIEILKEEERKEDEEIAALGLQIRAMLEKKSALRKVLYDAKEKNEIGNERLRLWEEEVLRLRSGA